MADNVVYPDFITRIDLPPERVLTRALEAKMQSVIVIGYDADGDEYFASSLADGGDVLWLLERCKKALLEAPDKMGA